jgi:hypothetical protein
VAWWDSGGGLTCAFSLSLVIARARCTPLPAGSAPSVYRWALAIWDRNCDLLARHGKVRGNSEEHPARDLSQARVRLRPISARKALQCLYQNPVVLLIVPGNDLDCRTMLDCSVEFPYGTGQWCIRDH